MNIDHRKRRPGRPKAEGSTTTMEQILRTAAQLFMEQGYAKVTLISVAEACGVTKASVYYYFHNKAALFTECILFVLHNVYNLTENIIRGPGSLQERMQEVAARHMRNSHVEFETMMRDAAPDLTEEQIANIRDGEHALHLLLADAFQQAIDMGEMKPCDPILLSFMYTSALIIRNRQEIINEQRTVEQAAEEMVQILWRGLAP